jgi:hypothetical protein
MHRTCGTYGGEKFLYKFLVRKTERDHMEDQNVDGRVILKWFPK